MAGLD